MALLDQVDLGPKLVEPGEVGKTLHAGLGRVLYLVVEVECCPSSVVAELLIDVLGLDFATAGALRAVAVGGAGRSRPR
jgi:hypothetical protein